MVTSTVGILMYVQVLCSLKEGTFSVIACTCCILLPTRGFGKDNSCMCHVVLELHGRVCHHTRYRHIASSTSCRQRWQCCVGVHQRCLKCTSGFSRAFSNPRLALEAGCIDLQSMLQMHYMAQEPRRLIWVFDGRLGQFSCSAAYKPPLLEVRM